MAEREPQMSYRDYLIWTAAHTAASLTEAIRTALDMQDEGYAIQHLEAKLASGRELLKIGETTDRVAPRPTIGEGAD